MIPEAPYPSSVDEDHLRVLSVLYLVYGGLAACVCLGAVAFLLAGGVAVAAAAAASEPPSSAPWNAVGAGCAGCVFGALGAGLSVLFGAAAALRIFTGLALRQRRYYTFCLVAAGITALGIPLGALLGVSTLIVLLRPSVERMFSAGPPLSKEHGVWVLRTGQPLPSSVTDGVLQQNREERDRANLGGGE
jgi:hypothetical protein